MARRFWRVKGLTAGYGRVVDGMPQIPILRDVGFELPAGGALGIIGESGSGKSTLARVIAGLLPAPQGEVLSWRGPSGQAGGPQP
jgi:peptide/nickel transport system ATP-binding protein